MKKITLLMIAVLGIGISCSYAMNSLENSLDKFDFLEAYDPLEKEEAEKVIAVLLEESDHIENGQKEKKEKKVDDAKSNKRKRGHLSKEKKYSEEAKESDGKLKKNNHKIRQKTKKNNPQPRLMAFKEVVKLMNEKKHIIEKGVRKRICPDPQCQGEFINLDILKIHMLKGHLGENNYPKALKNYLAAAKKKYKGKVNNHDCKCLVKGCAKGAETGYATLQKLEEHIIFKHSGLFKKK